jgi:hypothetical protein
MWGPSKQLGPPAVGMTVVTLKSSCSLSREDTKLFKEFHAVMEPEHSPLTSQKYAFGFYPH